MKNTKKRSERKRNFLQLSHRNDIDRGKVRKENRAAVLERERTKVKTWREQVRKRERERKNTARLPPEMTSPRDLGTETDLDRVNPHQAGLTRPGCSPSTELATPQHPESRRITRMRCCSVLVVLAAAAAAAGIVAASTGRSTDCQPPRLSPLDSPANPSWPSPSHPLNCRQAARCRRIASHRPFHSVYLYKRLSTFVVKVERNCRVNDVREYPPWHIYIYIYTHTRIIYPGCL